MIIAGVDEVGRGCLAGPVVACAVVLCEGFGDKRIKDSKKVSAAMREKLAPYIKENSICWGLGVVCSAIIDKINIYNAVKQAMHIAISRLPLCYDRIIIDSVPLNNLPIIMEHPNKADENYPSVSAASIIAKVYRDNLMKYLNKIYPGYGWDKNAGYGTAAHIEAIKKLGYTEIHRKSFKLKKLIK